MAEPPAAPTPAFYARAGGRISDWWTVLHPPYTAWHLSNVVIGAALGPPPGDDLDWVALAGCVAAFFLAVGIAAHALDELKDRPLRTRIGDRTLLVTSSVALLLASGLGVLGAWYVGSAALVVWVPIGIVLVLAYNLELFSGRLHSDAMFALSWGGFPVLVGFLAQDPPVGDVATWARGAAGALLGTVLAAAQRRLSTPARRLRRRVRQVDAELVLTDGTRVALPRESLLAPLEQTLRLLCLALPLLALTLLLARA